MCTMEELEQKDSSKIECSAVHHIMLGIKFKYCIHRRENYQFIMFLLDCIPWGEPTVFGYSDFKETY